MGLKLSQCYCSNDFNIVNGTGAIWGAFQLLVWARNQHWSATGMLIEGFKYPDRYWFADFEGNGIGMEVENNHPVGLRLKCKLLLEPRVISFELEVRFVLLKPLRRQQWKEFIDQWQSSSKIFTPSQDSSPSKTSSPEKPTYLGII